MFTFKASKLLFISAPSNLVCRSAVDVSAPLSFPKIKMSRKTDPYWYAEVKITPAQLLQRETIDYIQLVIPKIFNFDSVTCRYI